MSINQVTGKRADNIVLIGFMAAGKSSVGRSLAKELGWDFFDTDQEIENVTGLKIADLFKKYGEVRFRSEEQLIVRKLTKVRKTVIATGGGTVLNPENWDILKSIGILIHLYVPLELALQRAKRRQERPLLSKRTEEIEQLWSKRLEVYNKACLTIDTSEKDVAAIVAEIRMKLGGSYVSDEPDN